MVLLIFSTVSLGLLTVILLVWRYQLKKDFIHEMVFGKDKVHKYHPFRNPNGRTPLWQKQKTHQSIEASIYPDLINYLMPLSTYFGNHEKSLKAVELEKKFNLASILIVIIGFVFIVLLTIALLKT